MIDDSVKSRIRELIEDAVPLVKGSKYDQCLSESYRQHCSAWLTSAQHAVHMICGDSNSSYRSRVDQILSLGIGHTANRHVGEVSLILQALLSDIDAGMLTSIENRTSALIFDDFLDHAQDYFDANRKNEAGVIVGVVFEDSIRKVCRKWAIEESGVKLDELISELARIGVFSVGKAKRARASASLRTSATHARWDELDPSDVEAAIAFTREFVSNQLDE